MEKKVDLIRDIPFLPEALSPRKALFSGGPFLRCPSLREVHLRESLPAGGHLSGSPPSEALPCDVLHCVKSILSKDVYPPREMIPG
ncbi:MAG TPA: hypothetical protein VMS81_00520 [Methanomicrobiales archaeon]|nr:hypothetical protein [Methanomicrobiales archaeon]